MVKPPLQPPRATYRLQLTRQFTFRDAAGIADYLAALGISHAYLSPILTARPGSTHGYDVVDHDRLNPELGTEADFDALVIALRTQGIDILLDIVPNHMGIGPGNRRWMDVLEWGPASPEADFFDIDWLAPRNDLAGKVLLPVLDKPLETALDAGEIALAFGAGRLNAVCDGQAFPISPLCYDTLFGTSSGLASLEGVALRDRADRMKAELAGRQIPPLSPSALAALLDRQCWRLAPWRAAADDVNYRRFFAINDLIGIRVERPDVFEASHRTILRLVGAGKIDGLRVDHIDGLHDPGAYLDRLRDAVDATGRPAHILVEKILGHDEALPAKWPVAGTTGYDRLGPIDRLFIDPASQDSLAGLYRDFTGRTEALAEVIQACKERFLVTEYRGEIDRIASTIHPLAHAHPDTHGATVSEVAEAVRAVITALSVYRTYADETGISPRDRARITAACDLAGGKPLHRFLRDLLTLDLPGGTAIAMRFQQLSGPAMAKGLEDTAFYRYVPLITVNEVGGDPGDWALDPAGFHRFNRDKFRLRPHEMIAGSTHDTKRGEDARTRLACLSSMADEWKTCLHRWHGMNIGFRTLLADLPAPSPHDEYYLYQTLLGAWPPDLAADDRAGLAELSARVETAILKAAREAKERTNWDEPRADYEAALQGFVRCLTTHAGAAAFRADMAALVGRVAFLGGLTSLSATLLRLTTPGVPDIYQGAEAWNLAMVDPDNRRPVDFDAGRRRLAALRGKPTPALARRLLAHWQDGAIKTHLIRQTLAIRQQHPTLFSKGRYKVVPAAGTHADLIVSFVREWRDKTVVVAAPRLWPVLWPADSATALWQDTVLLPPSGKYLNVLTGETAGAAGDRGLEMQTLLGQFPVALLVSE